MRYKHQITVRPEDIDQMGHVNNVVYLRYVQETAEAHWKSFATADLQKEVVWVVLRHEIDYHKPAFEGDLLECETWVEEANGVKMPRNVVIKNEKGQQLISAKTIWCALDGKTFRPKRIEPSLYEQFI
uniref:acyl-CoA thioesterase n=1 Tax=Fulvivirga sp. TaxID=1931237 RepID=UPI0040491AB7